MKCIVLANFSEMDNISLKHTKVYSDLVLPFLFKRKKKNHLEGFFPMDAIFYATGSEGYLPSAALPFAFTMNRFIFSSLISEFAGERRHLKTCNFQNESGIFFASPI